jgi:hypothetical protein
VYSYDTISQDDSTNRIIRVGGGTKATRRLHNFPAITDLFAAEIDNRQAKDKVRSS